MRCLSQILKPLHYFSSLYPANVLHELTHLINSLASHWLCTHQNATSTGGDFVFLYALIIRECKHRVDVQQPFNKGKNEKCYTEWPLLLEASSSHLTCYSTSTHRLHKEEGRRCQDCLMRSLTPVFLPPVSKHSMQESETKRIQQWYVLGIMVLYVLHPFRASESGPGNKI